MRAIRVTIEIKDSNGDWFKTFEMPYDGAGDILLPENAAARIADVVQRAIMREQEQSQG